MATSNEANLNENFLEIRKKYTVILKEILDKYDTLPDWVFSSEARGEAGGCSVGEKCSVGDVKK
ncbi:hypothetical protein CPJCM30710_09830 [Clostridium polyendosporum]|uniref:Uncharacterized protein n=1 Tax=Clostridium polyendosporum TaxID=69208 RepID=A0A919RXK2_9CLOT|nr:hypothetical protein [Clostridium polyendosporum]GIM28317.1 hypothetical protein CPJCM30710_09830 [Clostridium polyendosporum]